MSVDDLPSVEVRSPEALWAWLEANHARSGGVWLTLYKKAAGPLHVPIAEVVRALLCWGWIDARTRRLDELRTRLLVVPRKPGSIWSRLNKAHVAELEAQGRIQPPGSASTRWPPP